MKDERHPGMGTEAAPDAITGAIDLGTIDALDQDHRIWLLGYDIGFARGQTMASVELARAWLLEDALRWTKSAFALARQRHGPAWATAIEAQAGWEGPR